MKLRGNKTLKGETNVPGDKSISHRGIILGAISNGVTRINNCLISQDTMSTINVLMQLGVDITVDKKNNTVTINGVGQDGLIGTNEDLYCGNSGTTMRLLAGVLCGGKFSSTLTGDESLSKRPMKRITTPLRDMGADISDKDGHPPIRINPGSINSINYKMEVSSAQVKSAILFASLYSKGKSSIIEQHQTRNHTELMLKYFGADIHTNDHRIEINNPNVLVGRDINVPGDISSAAFLIAAALITEDSDITITQVGLNSSRTGIISVLHEMGAIITIEDLDESNVEKSGTLNVMQSYLKGITISGEKTVSVIDEIPILAVLGCFAEGDTIIRDASELRVKESDRLLAIYEGLTLMGGDIELLQDGLIIHGGKKLKGASVSSKGDHRIAMALSIAALAAEGTTVIDDIDCISVSFPNFYNDIGQLIDNSFEISI